MAYRVAYDDTCPLFGTWTVALKLAFIHSDDSSTSQLDSVFAEPSYLFSSWCLSIANIQIAVVHETVNQEIHHVREEVITREIHNHEIYHRILPVIDVEVLPARHFLPVEGGGLVEVSADEVPSRGRSWVIAETASKIPSDEAAPRRRDRFSAREFVGTEGDTKEYMTPEGFMRKEETWVHPPELETGARDTGQSWPMEFGSPKEQKPRHRSSSGDKHSKTRSPRKQSTIRAVGE